MISLGSYTIYRLVITGFCLSLLVPVMTFAQKENKLIRAGNSEFEKGQFNEAEKNYRRALEVNRESMNGNFNLGTAVYNQKNYEESARIYGELAGKNLNERTRADVFYNLGNSLLESKKYEESIKAYEKSLISHPSDLDAKYNLEYARMMLKKQQEQQQKEQKNQDQNKDQDKKEEQEQKQDQPNEKENKENQQNKNQQQDHRNISKQDAERMLEAMKNDEKKTMQKVQKQKVKVQQVIIEKDW